MIRPAHHGVEVWLCVEPVDFRKQITGLATLVQDQLSKDPFTELPKAQSIGDIEALLPTRLTPTDLT